MIALAVDDEYYMREVLVKSIEASADIETVYGFSSCSAALEWVASHHIDVAFLDITMRGMSGMELAERIQAQQPDCRIVFCTGYFEYAIEAFRIHASGYLMKPITAAAVQTEIDHIKGIKAKEKKLTVKCFGHFEVLANNEALHFKRNKTKELLAYLVDRKGAGVTAKQICTVLWEDDLSESKHMNYFWQLLDDLRRTLREVGAENVLQKTGSNYALDMEQLDCDYIQYLKVGRPAFRGEYMTQYSWAEETAGALSGAYYY